MERSLESSWLWNCSIPRSSFVRFAKKRSQYCQLKTASLNLWQVRLCEKYLNQKERKPQSQSPRKCRILNTRNGHESQVKTQRQKGKIFWTQKCRYLHIYWQLKVYAGFSQRFQSSQAAKEKNVQLRLGNESWRYESYEAEWKFIHEFKSAWSVLVCDGSIGPSKSHGQYKSASTPTRRQFVSDIGHFRDAIKTDWKEKGHGNGSVNVARSRLGGLFHTKQPI